MQQNVGGIDRAGRIGFGAILAIAGIAVFGGYWTVGAVLGGLALVVGAILLVTGVTQTGVLNETAGIDTNE